MRELAEIMSDAHKKLLMLGIAEIYEQIAQSDENLAKERFSESSNTSSIL